MPPLKEVRARKDEARIPVRKWLEDNVLNEVGPFKQDAMENDPLFLAQIALGKVLELEAEIIKLKAKIK